MCEFHLTNLPPSWPSDKAQLQSLLRTRLGIDARDTLELEPCEDAPASARAVVKATVAVEIVREALRGLKWKKRRVEVTITPETGENRPSKQSKAVDNHHPTIDSDVQPDAGCWFVASAAESSTIHSHPTGRTHTVLDQSNSVAMMTAAPDVFSDEMYPEDQDFGFDADSDDDKLDLWFDHHYCVKSNFPMAY
ncbi:hypothetical protein HK104_002367 [Borealophlyctis nickersoniae]|nr:hypothetical protein HK104_002367 [Borealophlyctis nickersoniae]